LFSKIDHIGIAVKNLEEVVDTFKNGFNLEPSFIEEVTDQQVRIAGYKFSDTAVEYIEPSSSDSPIFRFLEKRNNALHHIAFTVTDLDKSLKELKEKGFQLIDEEPRKGANNSRIAFLHPASCNGILIELCEL
jgi:methylmalonyl-CoA/ethylmalonyl-CoA epimerase